MIFFFFFSSRRRHTRSLCDWSSDVCSSDLDVDGQRFDGVAVDIEWTDSVPDPTLRSRRLVELSERLRSSASAGGAGAGGALGAIVPPPVQLEDVNPDLWPAFPWRELAP